MANKKKIVLDPSGLNLKQFQAKHARAWKRILDSPVYQAGTQFLRNRALEKVALLSEEEIEKHSREHLAELRGILRHENDLESLPDMTDFTIPFEEPEVPMAPEQVVEIEHQIEAFQQQNQKSRYAH